MHVPDLPAPQALLGCRGPLPTPASRGPSDPSAGGPNTRVVVVHEPYSFAAYGLVVEACGEPGTSSSGSSAPDESLPDPLAGPCPAPAPPAPKPLPMASKPSPMVAISQLLAKLCGPPLPAARETPRPPPAAAAPGAPPPPHWRRYGIRVSQHQALKELRAHLKRNPPSHSPAVWLGPPSGPLATRPPSAPALPRPYSPGRSPDGVADGSQFTSSSPQSATSLH